MSTSSSVNFTMSAVVKEMAPSATLFALIKDNRGLWVDFGKKNSHILRSKITALMTEKGLSKDAKFLLYFFASLVKNKKRVLEAMRKLPESFQSLEWFPQLTEFINDNMVQFPADEGDEKFAMVHLPATNPPLTLLCLAIGMPRVDLTFEFMMSQQVMAQINLSPELQEMNKGYMKIFWEEQVNTTSNTRNLANFQKKKKEGKIFDEAIYKNQENDKYLLLSPRFADIAPTDPSVGYTEPEVRAWLASFTPSASGRQGAAGPPPGTGSTAGSTSGSTGAEEPADLSG